MTKLKEKIYYRILGLSIRCYNWSLDRYFDTIGDKRANTERIVKRTKMYRIPVELLEKPVVMKMTGYDDMPPAKFYGHNHKKENNV